MIRRWQEALLRRPVSVPPPWFFGAIPFTATLLGTTILHWDRFNHDHVSFWAWLSLYVSTPLLLPVLWAANQRRDPGVPEVGDVAVPGALRLAVGLTGIVMLSWAAVAFTWPDVAERAWTWPLTDLTARTVSGFVVFPAVVLAWFLVDDRGARSAYQWRPPWSTSLWSSPAPSADEPSSTLRT